MDVGHINLEQPMNGVAEHFVRLVEALNRQGVKQHVLVADAALARRVEIYERVQAGPVVRSSIVACCLMPEVDVVHVHEPLGRSAGLLLRLTRSMPYVVTRRETRPLGRNPVSRSVFGRCAGVICPTERAAAAVRPAGIPVYVVPDLNHEDGDEHSDDRVAAEHFRIYACATDERRMPIMLL